MSYPKIFEIIGLFTPLEREEFLLYLKSPFFMRDGNAENMLRLFLRLQDAILSPWKELPEKEAIHAYVYPEKAYSDARLAKAYSQLGQIAEQFLVTTQYHREAHEQQRRLDLARIYRAKRASSLFEITLNRIKKEAAKALLESSDHYFLKFQIAREEHEWHSTYNHAKSDLFIPEVIHNLIIYFLAEHNSLLNNLLLQHKVASFKLPDQTRLHLNTEIDSANYEQTYPLLLIQKKIQDLFLLKEPDQEGFETLIRLIQAHESGLSEDVIKTIYTYLRNFCTFLVDSGQHNMAQTLHLIHQDNYKRGYFYYDGQITPNALLNLTLIALRVNNIAWARQIVESSRFKILAEAEADDLYRINLALCFFAEKNYEEALDHLSFPTTYPAYFLLARRMELKIYYEQGSELLLYKIDAFRKFLERTAPKIISSERRTLHMNFVNIIQQLTVSQPKDAQRSARLNKRIQAKKMIADRLWLLEKARELS